MISLFSKDFKWVVFSYKYVIIDLHNNIICIIPYSCYILVVLFSFVEILNIC